jgi:predicted amidohydrolase
MKIAVAQIQPVRGDIQSNIDKHIPFIELAAVNGADMIIFPELSLTGYEPSLAKKLATDATDSRFDIFQQLSNANHITIGAGMPTKGLKGIHITMVLFQPDTLRQTNSKKYLHADEEPFFVPGENLSGLVINDTPITMAICYEISIAAHSKEAFNSGARVYIASVAKTAKGVEKAMEQLREIATNYGMTVLMSNCVGLCEDGICAGQSAAWNNKGTLLGQLNNTNEGLLILDTITETVTSFS